MSNAQQPVRLSQGERVRGDGETQRKKERERERQTDRQKERERDSADKLNIGLTKENRQMGPSRWPSGKASSL